MKAEAQRIAIAEACGKRVLKSCGGETKDHDVETCPPNSMGVWVETCKRCDAHRVCSIHGNDTFWSLDEDRECFDDVKAPNYPNDLNAMHEAEKTLDFSRTINFLGFLAEVIDVEDNWMESHSELFRLANATAAQRAEAFLRTIGKWEESA